MAGNKLGMDVAEVRSLGKKMESDSDQLTHIMQQITQKLNSVFWKGADAEHFKNEWNGQYKADLKQVASALDDFGKRAVRNAEQQDKASGA